jgi:hypothetical protein
MSDDYQRIELITGTARRRRWTTEQKLRIIEASCIREVVASAMMARRPRPKSSVPPKQSRRRRTGWPLAEAENSAGIPEGDRHAIHSAIAEWEGRTKKPRRRGTT